MPLDADMIADRRRLKRRVSFWRTGALAVLVLAAVLIYGGRGNIVERQHIARISVTGVMTDDPDMQEMIRTAAEDDSARAIILSIDSPGGTTTGAEAFYESVRDAAQKKPVVAVLGTVAASGAYIAAISADHIVARGNTITGSIGVIFQWTQLTGLLEKVGVDMRSIKSSPLKAEPSGFDEPPAQAIAATQSMIDASYDWFVGLVAERRKMSLAEAKKVGDGRVYTGWQAIKNGLVDEIGGEKQAITWLEKTKGLPEDLPVRDQAGPVEDFHLSDLVSRSLADISLGAIASLAGKTLAPERVTLDGLASVWHPEAR